MTRRQMGTGRERHEVVGDRRRWTTSASEELTGWQVRKDECVLAGHGWALTALRRGIPIRRGKWRLDVHVNILEKAEEGVVGVGGGRVCVGRLVVLASMMPAWDHEAENT